MWLVLGSQKETKVFVGNGPIHERPMHERGTWEVCWRCHLASAERHRKGRNDSLTSTSAMALAPEVSNPSPSGLSGCTSLSN